MEQHSSHFTYTPLEKDSVRLVHLLPSGESGDICCEIKHRRLPIDTPRGAGYFVALSYCWGSPDRTKTIRVNGKPQGVTQNLFDALTSILHHHENRTNSFYWIDALCINQMDIEERNEQVYLMWHIYASAAKVFIWLGQEGEGSDKAFWLLDNFLSLSSTPARTGAVAMPIRPHLINEVTQCKLTTIDTAVSESSDEDDWQDIEPLLADIPITGHLTYREPMQDVLFWEHQDAVEALIKLCGRQYFSRAWVVLEASQAHSIEILCGKNYCDVERFILVLDRNEIRKHHASTKNARDLFAIRNENVLPEENGALFFTVILQTYVKKACSDRRDRVYACLGDRRMRSVEDTYKPSPLQPDYSKGVLELAIQVMSYFDQLHEAYAEHLRGQGKASRETHLHSMAWDGFFRTLSGALRLPPTPALFYAQVKDHLNWTTSSAGTEMLTAFGKRIFPPGEALRRFLHPEYERDRENVEYNLGETEVTSIDGEK